MNARLPVRPTPSLEERLARLERANRRLRAGLLAAGAAAGLLLLSGAAADSVTARLRVESLEFVRDGNIVGRLVAESRDGAGVLAVYSYRQPAATADESASAVAQFTADEDGGILNLKNAAGLTVSKLEANQYGGAIRVYEKGAGRSVAYLEAYTQGGSLDVSSNAGKTVGFFDASENGSLLALFNAAGKMTSRLEAGKEGGLLLLNDADGEKKLKGWVDADGGILEVYNPQEDPMVTLTGRDDFGMLQVRDDLGISMVEVSANERGGQWTVWNQDDEISGSFGINPRGAADFFLNDQQGRKVVWMTTLSDGTSGGLQLFNPSTGTKTFAAP